jgi:hypothetical protein
MTLPESGDKQVADDLLETVDQMLMNEKFTAFLWDGWETADGRPGLKDLLAGEDTGPIFLGLVEKTSEYIVDELSYRRGHIDRRDRHSMRKR